MSSKVKNIFRINRKLLFTTLCSFKAPGATFLGYSWIWSTVQCHNFKLFLHQLLSTIITLNLMLYAKIQWSNACNDQLWKIHWKYSGNLYTCKTCSFTVDLFCGTIIRLTAVERWIRKITQPFIVNIVGRDLHHPT